MNNWIKSKYYYVLSVFLFLGFMGSTCVSIVPQGNVGVKVNKLEQTTTVLGSGFYTTAPWVRVYKFPTFMENYAWSSEKSQFQIRTVDGLYTPAKIGLSYHLDVESIPRLFFEYKMASKELTNIYIWNYIKDALNKSSKKMTVEELYLCNKQEYLKSVQSILNDDLYEKGIIIDHLYFIEPIKMPAILMTEINVNTQVIERYERTTQFSKLKDVATKKIVLVKN